MTLTSKTHFSKKIDDLYFNIVKIANEGQKDDWWNYAEEAGYVKASGGMMTFQNCLQHYNNPQTEVWVAYSSNEPVTNPDVIDRSGLEMYVSVTTSEHAPFTTHMGIQRVPSEKTHKNISLLLHEFCAKFMHEVYPEKLFMINTPQEFMREILSNKFKANDSNDAIYVFDDNTHYVTSEIVESIRNNIISAQESGKKLSPSVLPQLHLKEDLLKQREKIAKGNLFHNITKNDDITVVDINDKHTGNLIASLNSNDQEFKWFFNNYDLISYGFDGGNTPMISVELLALANLNQSE